MTLYKRLFLADDDADDRNLFSDTLMRIDSSINCLQANDGEAALQLLTNDIFEKPELIFLDINMPRMNGKQLLSQLKKNSELSGIPVIMYSTFFNEADIAEITRLGAVHHLTKHTSWQNFYNDLKAILNQKW